MLYQKPIIIVILLKGVVYAKDSMSMTLAYVSYDRRRVPSKEHLGPHCAEPGKIGAGAGLRERNKELATVRICLGFLQRAEDAKVREKRGPNVGIKNTYSTGNYLSQSPLAHSASYLAPHKGNLSRNVYIFLSVRSLELRRQQHSITESWTSGSPRRSFGRDVIHVADDLEPVVVRADKASRWMDRR